jgi:hypothetical protein
VSCVLLHLACTDPKSTPKPTPNPTPKPTTPALFGKGVLVLDLDRSRYTCAELNKILKTLPALRAAGGCTSDWPRQNKNTGFIAQPGTCDVRSQTAQQIIKLCQQDHPLIGMPNPKGGI